MTHDESVASGGQEPHRVPFSMKKLMLIVVCFAAVFWSAHYTWEGMHPEFALARSLRSRDAEDRRVAALELGKMGVDRAGTAVPALVDALKDGDESVRAAAADALGSGVRGTRSIGAGVDPKSVAEALGAALADPVDRVRQEALIALISVAEVVPIAAPSPMLDAMARGPSTAFRTKVAAALPLFRLDRGKSVSALSEALGDSDPSIAQAAAEALAEIGPEAAPALPKLIAVLKSPAPPAPPGVASRPMPVSPATAAALAIGSIASGDKPSAEAVAALEETLRSGVSPRKRAAAEGLYLMGKAASAAFPTLIATVEAGARPDGGEGYESWAARALGNLAPGTPQADSAIRALTDGLGAKGAGMQGYCAEALGQFGPSASSALPRLRALKESKNRFASPMAEAAIPLIEAKPAAPDASAR